MIKISLALCVAFAVVSAGSEYMRGDLKDALEECLAEDGSVDYDEFKQLMFATDRKVLCMFACATEKIGVFDGEMFDIEKLHERASQSAKHHSMEYTDDDREELQECLEEVNESGSDKCEKQNEMFMCFMDAANSSE